MGWGGGGGGGCCFFCVKDGGIRLKEWSLIVMCVFLDFF